MTLFARIVLIAGLLSAGAAPALAEDGYDLWMRYPATTIAPDSVSVRGDTPMLRVAAAEVRRALPAQAGAIVLARTAEVADLKLPTATLGDEGYLIRAVRLNGRPVTLVTGNTDRGVLYGAFALIRQRATGATGDLTSAPRVKLRVLNHWDNLDGVVERGYAGRSLWDWWTLPDYKDPRYVDYARANASLGINGTVLNNVNAKAESLSPRYIAKAAALADIFRPYGIRVYLSARFSAPI